MSSEFSSDLNVSSIEEGWKEPVAFESRRFLFHKVRVYGALQLLKQPRPEYAGDLLTVESLRKEFNIAYALNHPTIARYYRFEDNRLYEEYIDGVTLGELIENSDPRLSDPQTVSSLLRQLFEAIGYLHLHGIVHRDIKPENLIVTHMGDRLKIIDFGAAESAECDTTPGFTGANLAPEQNGRNASFQSDIYQAGLVAAAIIGKSRFSKNWKRFLARALHPDPTRRFHSAEEALKEIPSFRRRNHKTILGFAAVIVSILIAGYFLTNRYLWTEKSESATPLPNTATLTSEPSADPTPSADFPPAAALERETATPALERRSPEKTAPATDTSAKSEEERLKNEINRFVTDTYTSRLKKLCDRKPTLDERGVIINEEMQEFEVNFKEAVELSFEYGEKLSSTHPQYRDFIEETLYRKMESVGSVYLSRFYKPNEIAFKNLEP